ncbi:NlpC/P60 family protein [Blastococcus sp. URHD0036]|uniref:C40 family peptidase n=1 Tax=Blastococcus sp. URHD0036 TaxID=1380356 RepID=UPI0004967CB2
MTTTRTSSYRLPRSARAAAIALVAGAGIALTPTAALASPGAPVASVPVVQQVTAPNHAAQVAVDRALAQVGKPYVWGGAGPSGFDCSGLTQYAYRAAGVNLPHSSRMQSRTGFPIDLWHLQPGDLMFFYSPVGHVAMYIGNGLMVHASTPGQPVKVVPAGSMRGFVGATRVA